MLKRDLPLQAQTSHLLLEIKPYKLKKYFMRFESILKKGIMIIMSLLFLSCSKETETINNHNSKIIVSVEEFEPGEKTKTTVDPDNGFTITWASGDVIGIFPYEGYQEPFIIPADQVGKESATFDGGYWALKDGLKYNAYYPFDKANFDSAEMKTKIPVSYIGQYQNGKSCDIGAYDYTYSTWVEAVDGKAFFLFDHIGAIALFKFEYPATANYTKFTLNADSEIFPAKGTYDLTAEEVAFVADEESMQSSISVDLINHSGTSGESGKIYMMLPPMTDLSEIAIYATLTTEDGAEYVYSLDRPYTAIQQGKYYERTLQMEPFELDMWFPYNVEYYHSDETNKIKFIANSTTTSEDYIESGNGNGQKAYIVVNGEWVEIHTSAHKFTVNEECWFMFNWGIPDEESEKISFDDIDFGNNFDTSAATDMWGMFATGFTFTKLDLSCFNTSNVESMYQMFESCMNLKELDISSFNTENVMDMCQMFDGCASLESIDVSHFDTGNVWDMTAMFYGCSSLQKLDLSNFNTENVTTIKDMFNGCSSLTELDLSSFNTDQITDMSGTFASCTSLTSLDLGSFTFYEDTDPEDETVIDYTDIFKDLGKNAPNKPVSIYVTEEAKAILESVNTGINPEYAKLVVKTPAE